MLAAATNSPHLLGPVRAAKRRRLGWITAGEPALPFERAACIALAVDGLCLLEMLQVSPYNAEQRERITEDLLRLVDETAERGSQKPADGSQPTEAGRQSVPGSQPRESAAGASKG